MNIVKGLLELIVILAGAAFVLLLSFQLYLWVRLGTWVPLNLISVFGEQVSAGGDHITVQVLREVFLLIVKIPLLVLLVLTAAGSWLGLKKMNHS